MWFVKTILCLCATSDWIYIHIRKTQHFNYYKSWYLFLYFGVLHSKSIQLLGLCLFFVGFVRPFSSVVLKWNIQLIWKIIFIHFSDYLCVPSIQLEWIFLQRVTWDTWDSFAGVEKMIRKTFFASYFLRKDENPLPCRRSSKYNAGQVIYTGTPESSDVITGEVLKLHTRESRTDTGRDGRGGILLFWPLPDPKWGATWQEGIPGCRV